MRVPSWPDVAIFPPMLPTPIYLDHAATTPVRPEVVDAMLPYLGGTFGNPSSGHGFGRAARDGLERARAQVAEGLGVAAREVYFTSGGTEGDNLAVLGAAWAAREAGRPMCAVVAATEHKAVLAAAHAVTRQGGQEVLLPVAPDGRLDMAALDAALAGRPSLVSVMWVNNETGVIQPLGAIAERCRAAGIPFHSDLVAGFGKLPFSLTEVPLSLATITGHKLGAPKGIGALVVRDGVTLSPQVHGGSQQRGVRPGTENIAGAVALGCAVRLAWQEQARETARLTELRDLLAALLTAAVPDLQITGSTAPRAPHVLNVQVPGCDAQALLMHLDLAGIAASAGSACQTGAAEPSHVLTAMGVPPGLALSAVRLSLGHETTAEEVGRVAEVFPRAVAKVRALGLALSR